MSLEDLEALLRKLPPESTAAVSRQAGAKTSVAVDELALSLIMLEGRQAGRRIKVSERPITVGRDAHVFAIYLIDVCGHGVSAAMHSVSVLNVLRQHALPATDFKDPVQVLSAQRDVPDGSSRRPVLHDVVWSL